MEINVDPLEEFIAAGLVAPKEGTTPNPEDDFEFEDEDDDPPPPPSTQGDPKSEEDPLVKSYYEYLVEKGLVLLPEDTEEFDGTPEQLDAILDYTKQQTQRAALETLYAALPDDVKDVVEYALSGGTSLEDYLNHSSIPDVSKLDLSTPQAQKQVLKQYYKLTTEFSDEKINKLIATFEEDDELASEVNDAVLALSNLAKTQKENAIKEAQQRQKADQEAVAKRTEALVEAINTSEHIHPSRREKVRTFFFNTVNTPSGPTTQFNAVIRSIMSNPEHQAQLADILLDYNATSGISLDRLEKRVKSKGAAQLRERLEKAVNPKNNAAPLRQKKSDSPDFFSKWLSGN